MPSMHRPERTARIPRRNNGADNADSAMHPMACSASAAVPDSTSFKYPFSGM